MKTEMALNLIDAKVLEMQENHKTWHILHFIISIFTFGLWVIVWVLITSHHSYYRRHAYRSALRIKQEIALVGSYERALDNSLLARRAARFLKL